VPTGVGAQLAAQALTPSFKKLGELGAGERLGGLEEFITETTFCEPVSDSRSTAWETGGMVVTTGKKPD
jgi:hypothetical protein